MVRPHFLVRSAPGVTALLSRRGADFLLLALASAALTITPLAVSRRFFYIDDTQDQGLPSMHLVGRMIREGNLTALRSDLGPAGNLAVDPQYGLLFPVKLGMSVFVSLFDSVNIAAVLLTLAFNCVLALGILALLKQAGVRSLPAAAAALSVQCSGFFLLWADAGWQPALWGFSTLPWLWFFLESRRRIALLGVSASVWLVVGFAFPAATLCAVVLLLSWAVDRLALRRQSWREVLPQALAAAGGALIGFVNYLPMVLAMSWTARTSEVLNTDTLVPNLTDLVMGSSPVGSTAMQYWWGPVSNGPILYLGWFVIPLAILIPWSKIDWRRGHIATAAVFVAVTIVLSQHPSELGPLRYPFRYIAAIALGGTILLILAAARAGLRWTRPRGALLAASVALSAYLTWARRPEDGLLAVVWAAAAGAVLLLLMLAHRRWAMTGAAAMLIAGTVLAHGFLLTSLLPRGLNPDMGDWLAPTRISALVPAPVPADTPALALRPYNPGLNPDRMAEGIPVGFIATYHDRFLGQAYSSVRQRHLADSLCSDYLGDSCADAARFLVDTEPTTGQPWVTLLGYRYLVFSQEFESLERTLPDQWQPDSEGALFTTFRNTGPEPAGAVTWTSAEVQSVTSVSRAGNRSELDVVTSDAGPGRLVLREVFWPGWHATLDGVPVQASPLDNRLVQIVLPAGSSGRLVIDYTPVSPKLVWGSVGAGVALIALGFLVGRRRRADDGDAEYAYEDAEMPLGAGPPGREPSGSRGSVLVGSGRVP